MSLLHKVWTDGRMEEELWEGGGAAGGGAQRSSGLEKAGVSGCHGNTNTDTKSVRVDFSSDSAQRVILTALMCEFICAQKHTRKRLISRTA